MPNRVLVLILLLLPAGVTHGATREKAAIPLLDRFLELDSQILAGQISEANAAAERIAAAIEACFDSGGEAEDCVLRATLAGDELAGLKLAPSPAENTVTHALLERRGSCAAIVAVMLALGDASKISFTAIVLREHVLLGSATDPGLAYEALDRGRSVRLSELHSYGPMPPDGPARVTGVDFLPYYLDNLAARLAESGDTVAAERTFREAIHIAPKVARFHYNLGTFLVQRERYREGSGELTRGIDRGWRDADAYVNRGVARWKLGKVTDARRDFEEALRIDPGNREAVANLRLLGAR